ncbi:MAG: hypothetical protein GY935_01035 [Gammaproteobacteria bacterium]|nr:hypothetical protein [Gammaproteobacteria bacterium]
MKIRRALVGLRQIGLILGCHEAEIGRPEWRVSVAVAAVSSACYRLPFDFWVSKERW